jgi:murein DD-endopeptidase MepM/ murein hydrolase activator NlpD
VRIFDGYTWEFVYGHMIEGSSTVNVGDTVVAGQIIGRVGNTGSSTGAHLHFEIRENGIAIDPMPIHNLYAN